MWRTKLTSITNGTQEVSITPIDSRALVDWGDGRKAEVSWGWVDDRKEAEDDGQS